MALGLPDVTLCAVDCLHPTLAGRALTLSLQRCDFAEAILFSNTPVNGGFRHMTVDALASRADYSHFILKRLAAYIRTPFVLIVQWDGYVLNEKMWRTD